MDKQRTILIADDDHSLRELIRFSLEAENYRVIQATNGTECLNLVRQHRPDLVIMDVIMPQMDGIETCAQLRRFSQVPVLMLTAKKIQSEDVITGLDKGADDYIIKPFIMDELMARIRAILRRIPRSKRILFAGSRAIQIDQQKREVFVRGKVMDLTPTEYQILLTLAESAGQVVEHNQILRTVWGEDNSKNTEHLKVFVWHLRQKIEKEPRSPEFLLTEWGVGYRLTT